MSTGRPNVDPRLTERLRLIACCLALTVLCTSTRPGKIIADTKIDMAVDPLGFLGRALHLWDAEHFGQLQNQAAGYFVPMGPFYALGDFLGMPPWITQRLWLAALLCTAFLGAARLAKRLGVGGPNSRMVGALVYTLAPGGLAQLGQISSGYLPIAMLPWIMLPLVGAAEGGGRVKAAARSGIAVALCSGINASATLGVLIIPVLYVLTRRKGTPKVRILAWWSAAVSLASLWWVIPLLLTGQYGFSFLPYTENTQATTDTTGLVNVLRGAQNWVSYVVIDGDAWWPVGHTLGTKMIPVLATGLVAALGLAGLVRRGLPERRFLLLTALLGMAIMVAGHTSAVESPLAPAIRDLLDGPLAPLRNLHKFDAMVRLPLAFGLMHLLAQAGRISVRAGAAAREGWLAGRRKPLALRFTAFAGLAGIAVPALFNGLAAPGEFVHVPKYWRDAANWLNARSGQQAVLAAPGARFGEYLWGRPMDEMTQPLLSVRWGVRNVVASGSTGYTRLLDAIDQRLAAGQGSPGLTEVLSRMGVRYVLVRNDLDRDDLRGAWPGRVHQALEGSPGLTKVASFGQPTAGSFEPEDAVRYLDQPYPPLEVYEVKGADEVASLVDAEQALRIRGSPESLLALADNGMLQGRPSLINDDGDGRPGQPVVSDSLRPRQRNFGEIRTHTPTLGQAEFRSGGNTEEDLIERDWEGNETFATYNGVRKISASSSNSDATAIPQLNNPGALPYAALDGNTTTAWESGGWTGPVNQWLRVDFDRPLAPGGAEITFTQNPQLGAPPSRVAVETESGRVAQDVERTSSAQPLSIPSGKTRWLRVRILKLAEGAKRKLGARVAIPELKIQGVTASRTYRLPGPSSGTAVMTRGPGAASACMKGSIRWVCVDRLGRIDEEGYGFDRTFSRSQSEQAALTGTAVLADLRLVERYAVFDPKGVRVKADSSWPNHPAALGRSAFDGDPKTTWISNGATPTLTLQWKGKRTIGSLEIQRPAQAAGGYTIQIKGAGGEWREATPGLTGKVRFAPVTTQQLTLRFIPTQGPLQISELKIPGVTASGVAETTPFSLKCGFGPRLSVNGTTVQTKVSGTFGDLLGERPLRFSACSQADLKAGDNRITSVGGDGYRIQSVIAGAPGQPTAEPTPLATGRWDPGHREVEVDAARRSYLVVNENYNKGWKAEINGKTLRSTRVDGWRQAWEVPAGTSGTVKLRYGPDGVYRLGLLAGLHVLALMLLTALWPTATKRAPARAASPPVQAGVPRPATGGDGGALPAHAAGQVTSTGAARDFAAAGDGAARDRGDGVQVVIAGTGDGTTSRGSGVIGERLIAGGGGRGRHAAAGRSTGKGSGGGLSVAGLVAGAALGFWVSGILGVGIVVPVVLLALRGYGRASRLLLSGWVPAVAMMAGAASYAVGVRLRTEEASQRLTDACLDVIPQALGCFVFALLLARILAPDPKRSRPKPRTAEGRRPKVTTSSR